MKQFKNILMASALLCGAFFTACDDNDEKPVFPENQENVYDNQATSSMMPKATTTNACPCSAIWE